MTVFVDPPAPEPSVQAGFAPGWPRITCDGDVEELHAFARSIGLGPGWYSAIPVPEYALTPDARERAVRAGARPALAVVRRGVDAVSRSLAEAQDRLAG